MGKPKKKRRREWKLYVVRDCWEDIIEDVPACLKTSENQKTNVNQKNSEKQKRNPKTYLSYANCLKGKAINDHISSGEDGRLNQESLLNSNIGRVPINYFPDSEITGQPASFSLSDVRSIHHDGGAEEIERISHNLDLENLIKNIGNIDISSLADFGNSKITESLNKSHQDGPSQEKFTQMFIHRTIRKAAVNRTNEASNLNLRLIEKIHGINSESSDSDEYEGPDDFDEDYYKQRPGRLDLDPGKIVVINSTPQVDTKKINVKETYKESNVVTSDGTKENKQPVLSTAKKRRLRKMASQKNGIKEQQSASAISINDSNVPPETITPDTKLTRPEPSIKDQISSGEDGGLNQKSLHSSNIRRVPINYFADSEIIRQPASFNLTDIKRIHNDGGAEEIRRISHNLDSNVPPETTAPEMKLTRAQKRILKKVLPKGLFLRLLR